ncbi:MAG: DUF3604 domain-containing protein [bacterium]
MRRAMLLAVISLVGSAACEDPGEGSRSGRDHCELTGTPPASPEPVILFGDLHAHSSNSLDALVSDLPFTGGEIVRTPNERCLFARYCSQLDFWSLNDHPEEAPAELWQENIEAVRACNDQFDGYDHDPVLVTYLGWEWTHNGATSDVNHGHRNIVLRHTCDSEIPARPIAASSGFAGIDMATIQIFVDTAITLDPENQDVYEMAMQRVLDFQDKPLCPDGVVSPDLPSDCHEVAVDPGALMDKLDEWDLDVLVIPHGTSWGQYHRSPATWDHMFNPQMQPSRYVRLMEIYSGHGSAEHYRPYQHVVVAPDDSLGCPDPTADFEPCCWRAGEIVRRESTVCQSEPTGAACAAEVETARQAYVDAGLDGHDTVSGAAEDWLDCAQCRDCFQPAAYHRPLSSVQTALALSNFDEPAQPWRFKVGLVGSTDSHRAGPGAGYKELKRMSDGFGPVSREFDTMVYLAGGMVNRDPERQNSYFYSGGLVAVHAQGRSREDIWEALQARRTYATSGDRILLWFELRNAPGGEPQTMGAEVSMAAEPQFEVRAVGAFKQSPGCPDWVMQETSADFAAVQCFGECYYPTSERHLITRIEVVKITPQVAAGESLDALIQDPFLVIDCDPDPEGCTAAFSDADYSAEGRPASYYVRAIQEPTLQLNAGNLRPTLDATGNVVAIEPCLHGHDGEGDDCLFEDQERAWSSPIYLSP